MSKRTCGRTGVSSSVGAANDGGRGVGANSDDGGGDGAGPALVAGIGDGARRQHADPLHERAVLAGDGAEIERFRERCDAHAWEVSGLSRVGALRYVSEDAGEIVAMAGLR